MGEDEERSTEPTKYLLDTNVFNHVLNGEVSLENFRAGTLFATHVQLNELQETPCSDRRTELLLVFKSINPIVIPTESVVWNVSRWNQSKWSNGKLCNEILDLISSLDAKSNKNKQQNNQSRDALIAETAIQQGLTLITNDKNLTIAAESKGCRVVDLRRT